MWDAGVALDGMVVATLTRELAAIDVSQEPALLRLAEEVQATQQPRVLRRDDEDLAILMPAAPRRKRRVKGRPLAPGDTLFNIIGMAPSMDGEPTDVSTDKHRYLAEAEAKHGR